MTDTAVHAVVYEFIRPDGTVIYRDLIAEHIDTGWRIPAKVNAVDLGFGQWIDPPWILRRKTSADQDWVTVDERA